MRHGHSDLPDSGPEIDTLARRQGFDAFVDWLYHAAPPPPCPYLKEDRRFGEWVRGWTEAARMAAHGQRELH